ncbi:MAG: hypothetical protein Q9217_004854 [Psora testacea]
MAAVICNHPIDPTKSGKYSISISEELVREDVPRKRQRINIQYNYAPKAVGGQRAKIIPSSDEQDNNYRLSIKGEDGKGSYNYRGSQRRSEAMVLVYNPVKQAFVLNKVDTEFRFNLQSTPSNKDAASLAHQYPYLDTREVEREGDDLFGDAEGDEEDPDNVPADPANPYDYRHFLHRGASPSPEPAIRNSPVPNHVFGTSPLLAHSPPANRPRSRTEPKKPSQGRQRHLTPTSREEADADNEDSDPNELVIDMGDTANTSKPWRSTLGILNEGGRKSGPISLRSAASSMSPSIRGESENEKDDMGDHDVEEIDLEESRIEDVSPGSAGEEVVTNGRGWDDDDDGILEAELEQALEEQAENDQRDQRNGQVAAAAESSSESEEE